jgi:hypothetical protein
MKTQMMMAAFALAPLAVSADPLPKQIERLESLVGSWKGPGSMVMGKDKAKLAITAECKRTSAKFGVLCAFHATGMPGMTYEETDLFGYEPNSDTYHWYAVTNAGETHDHVAKPPSGDRFEFQYTGTQEGKPMIEAISFEFSKDGKTLTMKSETTVGGASIATMDAKVRK